MLTKKWRYCLHDAVHMVVSSSQKYFREGLWCPWLYRTSSLVWRAFSCFLSGVGAYLPPFVLHITDSASDSARSRRSQVRSAEDVDKNLISGLAMKASPWAKFVILWISSSPKRPGSHAKPHAAVQKCRFFSKRTSFDPPPSQTYIVRLKQNAGNWPRPLNYFTLK